jgi:hypothetical protein
VRVAGSTRPPRRDGRRGGCRRRTVGHRRERRVKTGRAVGKRNRMRKDCII